MTGMRVLLAALITSLLGAGCTGAPTLPAKTSGTKPAKTGPLKPAPSVSPTTGTPVTTPSTTSLTREAYYGRVLGLDGKPATNVLVRGQLVSNNGSGLIANNGGGIVAAGGANAEGAGPQGNYRIQQAGTVLMTRTDAEGYFELVHPNNQALNVEAELQEDIKAIRMNVGADLKKFELQLAHTGLISGKVAAPDRPEVTNFEGVRVYIPGTSYQATADAAGNFTLANVPVGTFRLVAEKTGLGVAVADTVAVKSKETTAAGQLALKIDMPKVTSLTQPNGGAGTPLTLKGEHFGASKGATYSVAIGGVACQETKRVDDATLEVTVPPGAGDNVVVTVDGIPSAAFTFKTIDKLKLVPPSGGEEEFGGRSRFELDLGSTADFTVQALDKLGNAIPNPVYTWDTPVSTAFTVANGTVTGKDKGRGDLVARSGDQVARLPLSVIDPDAPESEIEPYSLVVSGGQLYAHTENDVYRWNEANGIYEPLGVGEGENGDAIAAIAPAPAGGVYMALGGTLTHVAADGTKTPVPTGNLGQVTHFSVVSDGTLYAVVEDTQLKKLASGATSASVLATGLDYPEGMIANDLGQVFLFSSSQVLKSSGAQPTAFAKLPRDYYVSGSAIAGTTLYVTDSTTVKMVAADGTVSGISVGTDYVSAIAVADGKLYVADGNSGKVLTITLP